MSPLPLRIVDFDDKIWLIDDKGTYCVIPILCNKLGEITEVGRSKKLLKQLFNCKEVQFQSYKLLLDKLIACRQNIIKISDLPSNYAKCLFYVCTLVEHVRKLN